MKEEKKTNEFNRRDFMKSAAAVLSALSLTSCTGWESFLQKNFRELTPAEVKTMVENMEKDYKGKFSVPMKIGIEPPIPNTLFGYGLDLSRCVGCRRCVYACVNENNQSLDPQIHWIRVLEMDKEKGVDLVHANAYYDTKEVPREGHFYMPVACQHCKYPACTKACPVGATWKEPDGIVVIDYDWCIGCRCCMSACPYGARHFNWGEPSFPQKDMFMFSAEEKLQEKLDKGEFPKELKPNFEKEGFFLSDKVIVNARDKGKEWTIHDEQINRYFTVVKHREKKTLDFYKELNPNLHYLGNRPRPRGVVEKCTYCIQRVRKGRYPACVEVCPVGARKFGNLLDPESEIRKAIETKRVFIFKEQLNTQPSFFYFYSL